MSALEDWRHAEIRRLNTMLEVYQEVATRMKADRDAAMAERDALKADAEQYRWLRDTFSTAKAGAILSVNEPLMVYEEPEMGAEVRLQWFPHTPASFVCVTHSTLDAAIDAARNGQ